MVRCGFKDGYKNTHVFIPPLILKAFELTIINICFDQPLVSRKQLHKDAWEQKYQHLNKIEKIQWSLS